MERAYLALRCIGFGLVCAGAGLLAVAWWLVR